MNELFETETDRFFPLRGRGTKHMAQVRDAKKQLAGQGPGAWVHMHPNDPWVWAVFPDGAVRPCRRQERDLEAELDHPIV